jgi:hypothetical protein
VTRTFLVTVTLDDDEDVADVAEEIQGELTSAFGDDVSVAPWASPGEGGLGIFPQT